MVSPSSPRPAARCASSAQRFPVAPLSDAGFTKKRVLMGGGDGRERDARHPVDRRTQLFVGDAGEHTLDDDVADGQQAPCVHALHLGDAADGGNGEERRGLHLDREHAALRPALVLALARVVEEVARDDRADVHRLAHLLRRVDRAVDQLPGCGRAVRFAVDEVHRRLIGRHRGERDDQVPQRMVALQTAARADAHQPRAAELDQLLEDDRRARAAHAGALHGDGLAFVGPRIAEQPALRIDLLHVRQIRLGDVLRAQRIARKEDRIRIVAGLRTQVDWHVATLTVNDPSVRTVTPTLDQVLAFCADEPIERVFLEDIARRGLGRFSGLEHDGRLVSLCHVGANVVPSGVRCATFAGATVRGQARMIIGEEQAGGELWSAASYRMPKPRDDRPGQPVYVLDDPPEPGGTGLRPATLGDLERLVPACAAAHREEIGIDPLRRDPDGFRWRTRAQIEEGRSWIWLEDDVIRFKAEASAWTPSAVQLQQVWVDPAARRHGYAHRALRDLCRLLLERVPTVCLFVRPENAPALRLYDSVGMRRTISYRSLIF